MKKTIFLIGGILLMLYPVKGNAQAQEIQQLILNIEKLAQFKEILSDMKKGYDILSGGYKVVKDMSKGNFSLHKTFLDALMEVNPAVKNYKRVADIINYEILLVKESKIGLKRFVKSKCFTEKEISYFEKIYGNLLNQSLRNLDELTMVVTAGKLRMSDDERLEAVDKIYLEMQDKLHFLRNFNATSNVLALQRAKENKDSAVSKEFYGIK